MIYDKVSDDIVIASGRNQLSSLQKNSYLHNYIGNYEEIGGDFSPVDITIMDRIGEKIIKQQQKREQEDYNILGIKNIQEFNEKYLDAGGRASFIESKVKDIVQEAALKGFDNLDTNVSDFNESILQQNFTDVVNDLIDESYDERIAKQLQNGMGPEIAKMFASLKKQNEKPKRMTEYVNKMSSQINSRYREIILQLENDIIMQEVLDKINKIPGAKIENTSIKKNAYGKFIKADTTLLKTIGISAKNYQLINKRGDVEVTLHSPANLEHFYRLLEDMQMQGATKADLNGIRKIIKSFRKPSFKYHLINQAALQGVKKSKDGGAHIEGTEVGNNILSFIKRCLPLFVGAQMKIKGDEINVDFFNINGQLVPVSEILQSVFYGNKIATPRINFYSNYEVPWIQMRDEKLETEVDNGNYYSKEAQAVGGHYGTNVYNEIKVGTIHLRVALAKLK